MPRAPAGGVKAPVVTDMADAMVASAPSDVWARLSHVAAVAGAAAPRVKASEASARRFRSVVMRRLKYIEIRHTACSDLAGECP